MCPPKLNPHSPPSLPHSSGLSENTDFECPASCIELALVIYFTYGNIPFNSILSYHPTLAFSHRVQKSVLYIYVSFAVLHIRSSLLPSFFLFLIYFSWRLITLQYCDGFCHVSMWISHGCTCVPHPEPPSHHPLPSPSHPSGLSQNTSLECPASYTELALVIYFTYGNIHVSVLFSQIIPPSPFPTESKSLFFTYVSLLLSLI